MPQKILGLYHFTPTSTSASARRDSRSKAHLILVENDAKASVFSNRSKHNAMTLPSLIVHVSKVTALAT